MDKQIRISDYDFFYRSEGNPSHPLVVLAHCSGSSHQQWRVLQTHLAKHYHVLAPDLLGYGKTTHLDHYQHLNTVPDKDLITQLQQQSDAPCHLVGHSYGGAICLEVAKQNPAAVASLTLIEPVSFHLLNQPHYQRQWQEIKKLGTRVIQLVEQNRHKQAARYFINYWNGPFAWYALNKKIRQYICNSINKVAWEFSSLFKATHTIDEYQAVQMPTQLIVGTKTRRTASATIHLLHEYLTHSQLQTIPKAKHMSPITHYELVNQYIMNFIQTHTYPD